MRGLTFAAASAAAAALLFVVQPMVARQLLPLVGGSTVVWSAALVFFQTTLVLGYLVAHLLVRLSPRAQAAIYLAGLIAVGGLTLPFAAPDTTPDWSAPGTWVLGRLAAMVGGPFLLLAAASPLLQRWYARGASADAAEPYRLYAASNAGSMLGLLVYPFLIEPTTTLAMQALGWAVGYAGLVLLILGAALQTPAGPPEAAAPVRAPQSADALWWAVCAAIPAALLVTLTASITADIAPVPLLWVVPLAVYLGSYVWVFSRRAPAADHTVRALMVCALPYAVLTIFDLAKPWWLFAPLAVLVLGVVAVAYHRELVRTRPDPAHLTSFYLWTAAGGAFGGAFATFAAPFLFDSLLELPLELLLAAAVLPIARKLPFARWTAVAMLGLLVVALGSLLGGVAQTRLWIGVATALALGLVYLGRRDVGIALTLLLAVAASMAAADVGTERSAYARYRVHEVKNALGSFHELIVGRVQHGTQARAEKFRDLPLSYYHPAGPLGQVMRDPFTNGRVVGIGLGIGAMAAYARPEREVTFFELDPLVVEIARNPKYFSHLRTCGDRCDVEVGDGRVKVAALDDGTVSLLVIDAFSGDAIPTHLLTVEAFELYKRKLKPGGAILVNGSNRYIDVPAIVANAGAATGMTSVSQLYWPREAHLTQLRVAESEWVLLAPDPGVAARFAVDPRWKEPTLLEPDAAFTDDWQNMFAYYLWR